MSKDNIVICLPFPYPFLYLEQIRHRKTEQYWKTTMLLISQSEYPEMQWYMQKVEDIYYPFCIWTSFPVEIGKKFPRLGYPYGFPFTSLQSRGYLAQLITGIVNREFWWPYFIPRVWKIFLWRVKLLWVLGLFPSCDVFLLVVVHFFKSNFYSQLWYGYS